MATLILRMDPSQMERGADRAEKSLKDVKREAGQAESAIDRMSANGGRSTARLGRSVQGMGSRMQAARGQIQNAAFQLGDFATQVGAGTSASIALGQQLPQLLGGFGALGAVMGAVVAIGVPLAANFLDLGSESDDLSDSLDELRTAVDAYRDASNLANASTEELEERFGSAAGQIRSTLDVLDRIAASQAQRKIDEISASLANMLQVSGDGDRRFALAEFFDVNIGVAFTRAQKEARAEARALTAEFANQQSALERSAGDLEAQVAIMTRMVESATRLAEANGEVTKEEEDFVKELAETLLLMQEQLGKIEDAEEGTNALSAAAGLVADGFSSSLPVLDQISAKATAVANHMVSLVEKYTKLAQPIQMPASVVFGGSDPNKIGPGTTLDMGDGTTHTIRTAEEIADAAEAAARAVGGGGGSGASRIDQTAQAYQRLIASLDPAVRAAQDYAEAQDTIAAAQRAGIITADEAARAYGLAQEEYEEMIGRMEEEASDLDDITNATSDAFGQLFDGIIDGGTEAADVLSSLAAQLIKMGLQSALSGAFPSLFGDGGFLSFDGGGYTGSGSRSGGVDGKGGFPAILHPNETVVDHTKAANSGGGSGVSVQVNNFADNTETRQRRQSGPNGEEVVIDIVNKGAAEGRLTGVQSRYNLQNQKVRR